MKSKSVRAIDIFCGAGGSSYGATNAGIEVVAGFDLWMPAINTFKVNFPNAVTYPIDIRELSNKELRAIKAEIGTIDLILASPECTNHSNAKGGAERSETSKETAFQVIKFASEFRPQWIILENVVEMQSWDKYQRLLDALWNLNYFVRQVTLNAKDFGVAQSRERLFLLCSLSGTTSEPSPSEIKNKPASSIIDISGKYNFTELRKPTRAERTIQSADRAIAALGPAEPFLLVYYGSGRSGNGGWQTVDEPLGTVTTLDRFAYVVPRENGHVMRMLQPEELKLAMGFAPDFKLNAVPGLL